MVFQKEITAPVSLDDHQCLPTSIYQHLNGNRQRTYGRCASIDLIIKKWHAIGDDIQGIELTKKNNKPFYTKEYFTCTADIIDHQTVINHTVVNAHSKRKHIYPYGGYLAVDGRLGDALYMTLSSDVTHTKINIHSYQALLDQYINVFDSNSIYAHQFIDSSERHKILPLKYLIEQGDIPCELTTKTGDDTWVQTYHSESFVQKDGTYEGILTLGRKGKPTIRTIAE
jgi:DNA-directed RNA polymerase subunit H (RpoH/RPB5)